MYQIISETIAVAGVYKGGQFQPKKFQWRERSFFISQITSVHSWQDGTVPKRRFAVMAGGSLGKNLSQLYLLEFDRMREIWQLAQIWLDE